MYIRAMVSGITDMFTAKTAEECGADFIAFVFDRKSKDYVSPDRAAVIAQQVPGSRLVGVFKNEDLDTVNDVVSKVGLDYVQLNGHEDEEYIWQVACPVIKRYRYDEDFSVEKARRTVAEMILLDLGEQDYTRKEIAQEITDTHKSVILAANIRRENVKEVHKSTLPYVVEVSEGLETNGKKDTKKIRMFFRRLGRLMAG